MSSELCRIEQQQLEVSLRLTIHVPRWKPRAAVESSLVERWNAYAAALWRHESAHAQNGRAAARDIARELENFGQLEAKARARTLRILDAHRAWDARYDEETNHGSTQGAELG